MDRGTMRTEARSIFGETDASNSTIPESSLNTWANEAYRYVCTKLEVIPITETLFTIAKNITLSSSVLTIDQAKLLTQPDDSWEPLQVIDLDELMAMDPDWENATTGTPTHMVRMGTFSVMLYPPPDTDHVGVTEGVKTYGLTFDTLDTDTDTPDLPLNLHDVFPHYMAYRAFSRLQDPQRAGMELTLVNSILKSFRHMSTKFSDKRGWRMMESEASES